MTPSKTLNKLLNKMQKFTSRFFNDLYMTKHLNNTNKSINLSEISIPRNFNLFPSLKKLIILLSHTLYKFIRYLTFLS